MIDLQVYYNATSWESLDMFPDYRVQMDFQYFALGTFEGGRMPISDSFSLPYSDTNKTLLGVSDPKVTPTFLEARIVLDGTTYYRGRLDVLNVVRNGLNERIEVKIVDKLKLLLDTLKDSGIEDLLGLTEGDHYFTLFESSDGRYGQGIEGLNTSGDFIRYVYQNYNGLENTPILHRHNEPVGGADGIQQLQVAFNLAELLERSLTINGEGYVSKFIDGTSETDFPSTDVYVQFPMRWHGFTTTDRSCRVETDSKLTPMICGYREETFRDGAGGRDYLWDINPNTTTKFHNFRYANRIDVLSMSDGVAANSFFPFMNGYLAKAAEQTFAPGKYNDYYHEDSGLITQRSGKYKFTLSHTFDDFELFATLSPVFGVGGRTALATTTDLSMTSGQIQLSVGVTINGSFPTLFPIKTFDYTDFSDDNHAIKYGATFAADTSDTEVEVTLNQGDIVEMFYMVTSNDAVFSVGGVTKDFFDLTEGDASEFSLHFTLRDTTSAFTNLNADTLNYDSAVDLAIDIDVEATERYPLSPIARQYTDLTGTKTTSYEQVDMSKNVAEFIDKSLYDILKDVMGRFNMQLVYDLGSDSFYLDNMYEEYIAIAGSSTDISGYYDNEEDISYNYDYSKIKSISLTNTKGNSVTDTDMSDEAMGSLPTYDIASDGTGEVSYSSFMSIANGACYGEPVNEIIDKDAAKYLKTKARGNRQELSVKQYGIRIGFVNEQTDTTTLMYPSMSDLSSPNEPGWTTSLLFSDRLYYPRYFSYPNNAEVFPIFEDTTVDPSGVKTVFTIGYTVPINNALTPTPSDGVHTTIYQLFYESYVSKLYGKPNVDATLVLDLATLTSINIRGKYDYGDGDVIFLSLGGYDMNQEWSAGTAKMLIL